MPEPCPAPTPATHAFSVWVAGPDRRYDAGVSLEQLESFVAVVEEGGVVPAARRLHLTQPPLSRRIRSLEDELGVPLFERQARGMRLTRAGEQLLPHARRILSAVREAAVAVRSPTGEDRAGSTERVDPRPDDQDP
jgi:DNA-binding transcriptional LysR family regulator